MPLTLVLNCGSSSLKFALLEPDGGAVALSGLAEKLLEAEPVISFKAGEEKTADTLPQRGHAAAMARILRELQRRGLDKEVVAVGHRVVHGGEQFKSSVLITPEVVAAIRACVPLAPLHNPANLLGIESAQAAFPDLPQWGHAAAMARILRELQRRGLDKEVVAVGHRVVHGGEQFKTSSLITPEVVAAIRACVPLAPLHNPANLLGIESAQAAFPSLPHVAVFDTAFHQTMPAHAYRYAVPEAWYAAHGVRRYGFHGTSHAYVTRRAAEMLGLGLSQSSFVSAHLGNGCSIAAVRGGQSLDTSMGLTPLEGLVMGTRSGDLDPNIHQFIAGALGIGLDAVTDLLNKKSGLLGLSGLSNDMRELEGAASSGHEGAKLAIEVFCYRLAKYVAAMAVSLGRMDALIFTGGIGENSASVRAKVLGWLGVLGFSVDEGLNQKMTRGQAGIITAANSTVAMVVNTNEELMIAWETRGVLG